MKANQAHRPAPEARRVEYLFCYPSNSLIEACAVEGIARSSLAPSGPCSAWPTDMPRMHNGKKIGVCCFQQASGSENMFGGVAQVMSDNTPILILPGGNRRTEQGIHARSTAQDHYRNTTKWVEGINLVERRLDDAAAFSQLRNGGAAVMLETPMDVAGEEIDEALVDAYVPPKASFRRRERTRSTRRPGAAVGRAPVLLAGQRTLYAEAWEELRELAERPVRGRGDDEREGRLPGGPSALARDGGGGLHPGHSDRFLTDADLIFGVRASFSANTYSYPLPSGTHDPDHDRRARPEQGSPDRDRAGRRREAGARQLLDATRDRLGGKQRDEDGIPGGRGGEKAWLDEWMPRLTSDDAPIKPYWVIHEMNTVFDRRNTVVTHDGNPQTRSCRSTRR